MSQVTKEALNAYGPTRLQERLLSAKLGGTGTMAINPRNTGFCETCQSFKPAPKGRKKGWKCGDCDGKPNQAS